MMKNTILLLAATTALATSAQAASITLVDADFEAGTSGTLFTTTDPADDGGWFRSGTTNNVQYFNHAGDLSALMGLGFNVNGAVEQTVSTTFAAATDYIFSIDAVVNPITGTSADVTLELYRGDTGATVGSVVYSSLTNSGNSYLTQTLNVSAAQVNAAGAIGQSIGVRAIKSATNGGNVELRFDDATLDFTTVPEPSSAALLGLGGFALILLRRK